MLFGRFTRADGVAVDVVGRSRTGLGTWGLKSPSSVVDSSVSFVV